MKLCQIFSAGKHTDSKGNTKEWTTEDLDKIVYQFENVHKNAPICVGHPQTNSPAYGWLDNVKRIGNGLYCTFKDVQDEFKTAVNKGLFKNRSISLDKDLNIRHLAFLGGQAPAVKGLEQFCFESQENDTVVEFSDYEDISIEDDIQKKERNEKLETEELKEQLKAKDEEIAKLKREADEQKQAQKIKEFEDFADNAIANGNILPKHKESIVNILNACDTAGTFNFADEEKSGVEVVKDFISELKMMNFQDIATNKNAQDKQDFSDAKSYATEIQKIVKEKGCTTAEAYSLLVK